MIGSQREASISPKTILLSIILPVFAPLGIILAAIWSAASWTERQDNKFLNLFNRMAEIELVVKGDPKQDSRIGQLEYRLNWMDAEKNRDRDARIQIDRDIRDTLDRLKDAVTRLEAWNPRRRSDLDDGMSGERAAAATDASDGGASSDSKTSTPEVRNSQN